MLVRAAGEYSGPFFPRTRRTLHYIPVRCLPYSGSGMNPWNYLRGLFRYLFRYLWPDPLLFSPRYAARKHIAVITALLGVAAIAGAVVLTPSHHSKLGGTEPDLWQSLRQRVSTRAQVDLFDDFSGGLGAWQSGQDAWQSGPGLASAWSYDKNGFVNPGSLSLLKPSMHLTDYDLDALVQIEAKGLGLVFRAVSARSYQVAELLVEGAGPMPSLVVVRYATIAGHPLRAVRTQYPKHFLADTLYRVHLEVRGDLFSLYIQGNLVDYWTDPRLTAGGVGIFCSPGEHARVPWIRVSHNTDSLGRMCSLMSSILKAP